MPQQPVQLGRRHLGEHALLELEPQPRHADEHGRPRALQVLQEGVQRLGEEHVRLAVHQRRGLDPRAFEAVRQRQVRQDARVLVFAQALVQVVDDALGGARDGAEVDHRALGPAGGARGVDDHRQLVLGALRLARQRRRARDDLVPGVEGGGRRQRQRDAGQAGRHAGLLLRPGVELADEQQAGLAVAEHVADGLGRLGGEDGHRGVAAQPDGQLGHDEVRAVLRQDGDARAAREAVALQVRGHAPRLVEHLRPGVVDDAALALRLGQVDAVGQLRFVVEDVVEDQWCGVSSAQG